MMFSLRRAVACIGVVALGAGASLVAGAAPGGASARPSSLRPAAATPPPTAGINGLCGGIVVGALPTNLREGQAESNTLHVYREQFNLAVGANIPVDFVNPGLYSTPNSLPNPQPTVHTGTLINSYLIHSDPPGDNSLVRLHRAATIGFTTDIVGVQVLSGTINETEAVNQLRNSTATYSNGAEGIELNPQGKGDFARVINNKTLAISFKTSSAVDEIRVLTKATASAQGGLTGYRMLAADGGVFDFGGQQFYGSTGGKVLNKPVVAGVNTCSNAGYWFVASDGGVFSYGDAVFHGSDGGQTIPAPVVAMATIPTGTGYYLALANGEVDAKNAPLFKNGAGHTDLRYLHLNQPVVAMAVTPSGLGYWLVAKDGGVFSFGDAPFYGSTGNIKLNKPVIGMFAAVDGLGYYMYASDGGMFTFMKSGTHEPFFGSAGNVSHPNPVVGARLAADGQGYWFDDSAGIIFNFGPSAPKASPIGDMTGVTLFRPMIGMM